MRSPFFSIPLLLILVFGFSATGQKTEQYQGTYRLGNWEGWAQFDYRTVNEKRLKQGAFEMHSNLPLSRLAQSLTLRSAQGQFRDDQAHGAWLWQQAQGEAEKLGRLKEGFYQIPLSGQELQLQGTLDQARAVQDWQMLRITYHNGAVGDSLAQHQLQFSDQGLLQSFVSRQDSLSLRGSFDAEQRLSGTWELHLPADSLLHLQFEKGLLRYCSWGHAADSLRLWTSKENMASLDFGPAFLQVLRLQTAMDNGDSSFLHALMQLEKSWHIFERDWRQARELSADFLSPKKTWPKSWQGKLPLFALSEKEKKALRAIAGVLRETDSLYQAYAQNSQLDVLREKNPSLEQQWGKIEQWHTREWHALDSLQELERQQLFQHLNRSKLSQAFFEKQLWGAFSAEQTRDSSSASGLGQIAAWAQEQEQALSIKIKELQASLDQAAKQQKLSDAEIILKRRYKLWQTKLDSCQKSSEESPLMAESYWQQLRQQGENWYREFENTEDPAARLDKALALQACFKHMISLAEALAQVPEQYAGVKRAYTQEVWNPYTYTTMEEIVKERLFKSYQNLLLPSLMQSISEKASCADLQAQAQSLTELRDRMLELRDGDSEELERMLRRSPELSDILQTMELQWPWR